MADEWISAAEALKLISSAFDSSQAPRVISSRAAFGLIAARATRLMLHNHAVNDADVPFQLWGAAAEGALRQDWIAGDFETWIDEKVPGGTQLYHVRAFGVSFSRDGVEALIAPALASRDVPAKTGISSGGRPAAAWWDDLWVEIAREIYVGDLKPTKQADIESAMMAWASARGFDAAHSTIRSRARKLWTALDKEDEN